MTTKTVYKIVMIGPQGSGKGTQSQQLANQYGLVYISTGAIFRQAVAAGNDLGSRVRDLLDKGQLVPDETTNALIKDRLLEPDCQNGFILDGYPRNLQQAEFLNKITELTQVFEIWISDKEAVRRISGRRMAPDGKIYHLEYNPPPNNLQGELSIRDDDQEPAVIERLKIYHQQTEPMLDFYKQQGKYYRINGEQTIPQVNRDIIDILE